MAKNTITLIPEDAKMLRIKADKIPVLLATIGTDDNHKPDPIKITQGKARYELHDPKNPNNPDEVGGFMGVVLFGKQVFVDPREGSKAHEKIEKRVLSVLRWSNGLPDTDPNYLKGRVYPETFWVSKSGVPNFGKLCKDAQENFHVPVFAVLVHFDVELARNQNGDTWGKPVFRIVRELTESELAYTKPLTEALIARDERYRVEEVDTSYEENAFGTTVKKSAPKDAEDDVADKQKEHTRKREIEDVDDDVEATPKKSAGKATGEKTKAKPAAKKPEPEPDPEDDEEGEDGEEEEAVEETKPAAKTDKPATKKPVAAPVEDDEDDEDEDEDDDAEE